MERIKRKMPVLLALVLLFSVLAETAAFAEEPSTRWADAADEIDKYLDAAFEYYLEGDAKAAYDSVSNAYFRVYETTGFERQTMSYVSGNRKNAVEAMPSEHMEIRKEEHLLRLLLKDQSASVLEAILILSKRYYSVRIIDISQVLGRSSAAVRTALERLEEYGLVSRGEKTTVKLSRDGRELAELLYRQHETLRNEMIQNGLDVFEAEQRSIRKE